MKAFSGIVLAITILLGSTAMEARAGGSDYKSDCNTFSEKKFTKGDYALLPFRAIPWAAYYLVRLPARFVEYSVYGETGEHMSGIPDAAPTLH